MACFSDAVYIIRRPRSHPAPSDIFEPAIVQVQLGHNLLEILVLTLEVNDFVGIGFANNVTRETLLAGFQKVFDPAVLQVGIKAFPVTY